jgi:UDP-N-acetyl-D-mannosaminuronate dehydrogenase
MKDKTVCIVGLGYVGLPLAKAFSKHLRVIGYDVDSTKIDKLTDNSNERNLEFTADPSKIKQADFMIIAVPTPVTKKIEGAGFEICKIRYGTCWSKLEEWCNSSLRIDCLSWRYRRNS